MVVLPQRAEGWTVADLDLFEDHVRVELVDGRLEVSPPSHWRHGEPQSALIGLLLAAKPPGWLVIVETGLRWSDGNLRIPSEPAAPQCRRTSSAAGRW